MTTHPMSGVGLFATAGAMVLGGAAAADSGAQGVCLSVPRASPRAT